MRDEQLNLSINNLKDHLQNLNTAWDDMREQVEYFRANIQRTLEEIDRQQLVSKMKKKKPNTFVPCRQNSKCSDSYIKLP